MKKLTKFTNTNSTEYIYINLDEIIAVEYNSAWNNPDGTYGCTILYSPNGTSFSVKEHVQIVLAKVQGLDPTPAEVMYGKKD